MESNVITVNDLKDLVDQNSYFKSAYFWSPPSSASSRRWYEKNHSRSLNGVFDGNELDLNLEISCSCKNIYVNRKYYVNGKKTTITKIKNLINKHKEEFIKPEEFSV